MNPFKALVDLILPRICHICGEKLMEGEKFICMDCMHNLPRTYFQNYWQNTSGINTDLNPMEERFAGQLPLAHATSFLFYTHGNSTATLVHDFKYRNFPDIARLLGTLAARELLPTGFFQGVEMTIPVPLHWRKHRRRGYNQSELIAKGIEDITQIPVCTGLKAVKSHRTQTSLNKEQRIQNTRDIFGVKDGDILSAGHILLVDDICTSGATLLSAAKAILDVNPEVRFSIFSIGFAGMS